MIAIVVAPSFEGELGRLAADRHVWALRLPEYERVAQERWSMTRGTDSRGGLTLFNGSGLSPEAELVEILPTVEEHHSDNEIEVYGADPTADVRAELSASGFGDISPAPHGFTARRHA